jgi:hypothetical protein
MLSLPGVDYNYGPSTYNLANDSRIPASLLKHFKGPSMEVFYKNLSFLVQGTGKHWLFHDTPLSGNFLESQDAVNSLSVQNWENLESVVLVFVLSFDTSTADPKKFREFKKLAWQGSETRRERLTAKRFLQIYFSKTQPLSPSARENRTNYRVEILKSLKKKYHKIDG